MGTEWKWVPSYLCIVWLICCWVGPGLCQLVGNRQDGSTCRGNVHCISKCCFVKKGESDGTCVTPPAGMYAICGEQISDSSAQLQQLFHNYIRQQQIQQSGSSSSSSSNSNNNNNNNQITAADQRRQFITTQGQPYGFGGFPGQLVTTASQGTTVTGAFVYVCSTCDTKCCCGTACCDANVCTTVGTTAAAAITGTLCTGCNSLCCCGAQCCAATYCGLPNPGTPIPPIQATGVAPMLPSGALPPGALPPGVLPPTGPATPLDVDPLTLLYLTQMTPPMQPFGMPGLQQGAAFPAYAGVPIFGNVVTGATPFLGNTPTIAPGLGFGNSILGGATLYFSGNGRGSLGLGTDLRRRKMQRRPKRRAIARSGPRRWGWSFPCSTCCGGCAPPIPPPMPPPIPPPFPPPPMSMPMPIPPPVPVGPGCPCGFCQGQCCACGAAPPPMPPPVTMMVNPCYSCQCGCCGQQCCVCQAAMPALPPLTTVLSAPAAVCSNCLCGCCTYQCCACPASRYPTIYPLQPLAPRYPIQPVVPAYGAAYGVVPMAAPTMPVPVQTSVGCTVECSCGCCGQTCCTCKDSSMTDAALKDAYQELQKARDETKIFDTRTV